MMGGGKVYVGNLPDDVRQRELEDVFGRFGRIRYIDIKTPTRPPCYAFVEYESLRDAEDAVRDCDGMSFGGERLRVELARGGMRMGPSDGRYAPPGGYGGRPAGLGPSPYGPSKRTDFKVRVEGLPKSCSWQDLKDHMRQAGEVTYANVFPDKYGGMYGIVHYNSVDDLRYALRKLDDSDFRNPFERCRVRLREERDGGGGGGGGGSRRSRSRSRDSRSRSRSRGRDRRDGYDDYDRRRDRGRDDDDRRGEDDDRDGDRRDEEPRVDERRDDGHRDEDRHDEADRRADDFGREEGDQGDPEDARPEDAEHAALDDADQGPDGADDGPQDD